MVYRYRFLSANRWNERYKYSQRIMEWTGGVDHGIVAPSVDELIEGAVWGHVRNDAEGSLASFFGSENRLGLNRLGWLEPPWLA